MYTPEERERLRAALLAQARADARLSGGAITGSASVGREDRWSDIDLAFGVRRPAEVRSTLEDWSSRMYERHGTLHHVDVTRDPWIYRVFLLPSTLQVDLAFAPAEAFGPRAPTFRLVFGEAAEPAPASAPPAEELAGYGWLYALHVRSSIARRKLWQAEVMLSAMRERALALACVRHGLPSVEGRGIDALPASVTRPFEETLARSIDAAELKRAFAATADALLGEIECVSQELATRVRPALAELVASAV